MSRKVHSQIRANFLIQLVKINSEGYPVVIEQFTWEKCYEILCLQ